MGTRVLQYSIPFEFLVDKPAQHNMEWFWNSPAHTLVAGLATHDCPQNPKNKS
jgi:hypothetical protein